MLDFSANPVTTLGPVLGTPGRLVLTSAGDLEILDANATLTLTTSGTLELRSGAGALLWSSATTPLS